MIRTLNNYLVFLRAPRLLKLRKQNKHDLWRDFLWLLIIDLVVGVVLILIQQLLLELTWIKEYESFDLLKKFGVFGTLFIACVVAPVLEEALFRLPLRNRNLTIYFVFISFSIIIGAFVNKESIKWATYFIFFVSAIIMHLAFSKKSIGRSQRIWMRFYPILFYYTAILFGLAHLSNFDGLTVLEPVFILFILPQIIMGFSLGYIRIKYGLIYSILLHSCFNSIIMASYLIFN